MTAVAPTMYTFADGTPFPVEWETPDDALLVWTRDLQHYGRPLPPLEAAIWWLGRPGIVRAFQEAEMPIPAIFERPLIVQGCVYFPLVNPSAATEPELFAAAHRLNERHGGPFGVWESHCLPPIRGACAELTDDAGAAPLADLAERWLYAFHLTQVALVCNAEVRLALDAFCSRQFGADGEAFAQQLSTGGTNETLHADQAVWELAQIAARWPALRQALLAEPRVLDPGALRNPARGSGFAEAFDAYLERYGDRAEGWDLQSPTPRERPDRVLAMAGRYLRTGAPAPAANQADAGRQRAVTLAALEQRLIDDPPACAELRRLAAANADYAAVREDRAHWQLTLVGVLRRLLLRRGARLVAAEVIAAPEDVLFLLPEELEDRNTEDRRSLVAERKAATSRVAQAEPPLFIGAPAPRPMATAGAAAASASLLVGLAGSQGTVTARARVVQSLDEADALQLGEVLVCETTTSAWTALFGIAAAIVTETGAPFTHAAIVAREYGIPCVVGAVGARNRIADGALITVDGTGGTVRIET